ncbi:MAG TPA: hypothetical protein DEO36_05880 [Flavobacteriaceae bacterium]|jgi:hypothetical protein|nr:hypothetical protein [Flavobacteriaceae bacterium]
MKDKLLMIRAFYIFVGVLLWGTYFLPIHSFYKIFRLQITDLGGFYNDAGIQLGFIISIFLTIVSIWLSPKYFKNKIYKIIIIAVYMLFYIATCIGIGWDHRANFGTTWLYSEIFPELIKSHWYFYVIGLLGLYFNYKFQELLFKK